MKIRRFFSVFIACVSCITFFIVPASAEEGYESISVTDMNIVANESVDTTPSVDGGVVYEDITNELNIKKLTSGSLSGYTQINFPATGVDNGEIRLFVNISLTDFIKLNSEHEYSLSFNWSYNVALTASMNCALRFYDNDGNLLKEQNLSNQEGSGSSINHTVDISFVPDTTDITSGYKCEFYIYFLQSGYNSNNVQRLYISDISLIDNDDMTHWYSRIYNAIIQHDSNVDDVLSDFEDNLVSSLSSLDFSIVSQLISFDSNVDSYIDTLDNHIKVYLQNLGNNLLAAISSLDSNLAGYIKSFQDTLIANDNSIFEALKEFLHNEMNPGVYEDPGEDDYQSSKDEFEQIEGDLPSFDSSDMHEVDISNYSGGFGAVRYLFDRFLDASGLTILMSFSLMFGLGVFLIGRKVGG